MSMQVGDGWKVLNERGALLFAIVRGKVSTLDLPSELIVFLDASAAGSVDALIDEFGAEPSITAVGEATDTNLAGFPGKQRDFVVVPNPGNPGNPANDVPPGVRAIPVMGQFFTPGFTWTSSTPEASLRSMVVEVGDSLLLVTLEAPAEDFETLAADAEEILRSLAQQES
jgi:hypothetical protein